ncbi:hypothetical protein ACP4OV_012533 [Aristida adscensionis]
MLIVGNWHHDNHPLHLHLLSLAVSEEFQPLTPLAATSSSLAAASTHSGRQFGCRHAIIGVLVSRPTTAGQVHLCSMDLGVLLVLVALLVVAITWLWEYTVMRLIWRPHIIAKEMRAQGIRGPSYKFLKGCNEDVKSMKEAGASLVFDVHDHNYLPKIAPHFLKWRAQYAREPFLYWFGPKPRICIFDYELARQILSSKSGHFMKNDPHPTFLAFVGKGLALLEGTDWVRHHRVLKPAFAMDKLKIQAPKPTQLGPVWNSSSSEIHAGSQIMTKAMLDSSQNMVKELEDRLSQNKKGEEEVDLNKKFSELTVDVISHAIFGGDRKKGKEVFQTQGKLHEITMKTTVPNSYLPTERNRHKWMLEKKLRSSVMQIMQSRLASKSGEYGNDLLGLMLDASNATKQGGDQSLSLSMEEIIHECKLFFFAGHENTSLLITWAVFLLSVYPEWQDRLRKEVLNEFGREHPSPDAISRLKEMTMVLLETLRLYCPALFMQRKPITDSTLGATKLPKGLGIVIPIPVMHRDKEIWGDNADEFDPLRFENGITRAAKVPHALLAFALGPRSCIGQNFAMLEAKSVLTLLLQNFSFTIAPNYVHAPVDLFSLKPKFGLPVILRQLDVCN